MIGSAPWCPNCWQGAETVQAHSTAREKRLLTALGGDLLCLLAFHLTHFGWAKSSYNDGVVILNISISVQTSCTFLSASESSLQCNFTTVGKPALLNYSINCVNNKMLEYDWFLTAHNYLLLNFAM